MSTRHDRREQLKKDRRKQQHRKVTGKRVTPGWVAPAIIAGVAVLAIFGLRAAGVFEPPPAAITPPPSAVEKIGTHNPDSGNGHVPQTQRVQYAQQPPTSGQHWDLPHAGWGVKDTSQDDERAMHNLEHGGIVINYKGLSPGDLASLKTFVRQLTGGADYRKVLLRPYDRMDNGIVATAWNWALKLDRYDESQLTKFVQGHYGANGESPEPNGS